MALILNDIPLPLAFRRARCLAGDNDKPLRARRCVLIREKSELLHVLQGDFVFVFPSATIWDSSVLIPFLENLYARSAAGVCFCGIFTESIERSIFCGFSIKAPDFPVYTVPTADEEIETLVAELSSRGLGDAYKTWLIDTFFAKLSSIVENSADLAKTCILWLERHLNHKVRVLWADSQIRIPSLEVFELDSETAALLFPTSAHTEQDIQRHHFKNLESAACAFTIRSAQRVLGYLVAFTELKSFPDTDAALISQCLPYIAMGVLADLQNQNYLRLTKKLFFRDLLFSDFGQSTETVLENAALLGYITEQQRRVLAVRLPPEATPEEIQKRFVLSACPFPVEYYELFTCTDYTVLILVITDDPEESTRRHEKFLAFLKICNEKFAAAEPHSAAIGIGTPYNSFSEIAASYQEAVALLNIGCAVNPQPGIYYLRDYLLHYVVFVLKESPVFLKIYCDSMDRLQSYKTESGQEIIRILATLSAHNFSVQQAASSLFLHRNSLYDRIKSVSNTLEMDLREQEHQLLLHMLLILYSLLSQQQFSIQLPGLSAVLQSSIWAIPRQYKLPEKPDACPEVLEFNHKLQDITVLPYTLENLLLLANTYLHHPIDLISAEDFSGFTKHNSLILLNVSQALEKNAARLYNSEKFICFKKQQLAFVALKVKHGNHIMAYLTVNYERENSITIKDLKILECLAPYVATWLMTQKKGEATSKVDLYRNLLIQHHSRDGNKLQRECLHFGIQIRKQRFVIIISVLSKCSHNMDAVLEIVEQCCTDVFCVVHCGDVAGSATLLLENNGQANAVSSMSNMLAELTKRLRRSPLEADMKISVSRPCSNLSEIAAAYKEANISLTIGKELHPDKQIYDYKDYIIYHILCTMWGSPALNYLYRFIITPILNYDKHYRANLMTALEAYANANFCISAAARKSRLHRNTLYKKVAKAQDVLGMDFSAVHNQIAIQLAVKISALRKIYHKTRQTLMWSMPDSET